MGTVRDDWMDEVPNTGTIPTPYLDELRQAVEAGITPKQLIAMVNLMMMTHEMMEMFEPVDLAGRVNQIVNVIGGDIARAEAKRRLRSL